MTTRAAPLGWEVVALDAASGLGAHEAAWNRLNATLHGGHVLLDGEYVSGMLRHFPIEGVHLAQATCGGETVAMLLLTHRKPRLGVWASYLPSQAQVGPSLVRPDVDLAGLYAALPGLSLEVDLLCNDPRLGDLRELPGSRVQSHPHALTMAVSLRGGFDEYWAMRPRKLIQNMRRYWRRVLTEPGTLRLDVIQDPAAVREAVERYAGLESSGWKGREGTAVRNDNSQGHFYRDVMGRFAELGEALVYELWLGDELIASRMLLVRGTMAIMLKTAFQERFDRLAPGRLLLMRTLEDLFKRLPTGVVEFYTDAEADLLAWSTSQRWINHVSFYRHHGLRSAYGLLRRGLRNLLRRGGEPMNTQIMVDRSGAVVDSYEHVRELPADALALLAKAEQQRIEFGADWYANLIDTVYAHDGSIPRVAIYVLRRQGQVLAVLPTVAQKGEFGKEVSALSNFYTAIFAPALATDLVADDLLPLTRAIRQRSGRAAAYRFTPMDPVSREFGLLKQALQMAGLSAHDYFAFGNWYEPAKGSWAVYLKDRSSKLRNTIKRMGKRFSQEGGTLEIVKGGERLEAAIQAFQTVYAHSWKNSEPYPEFVPALARLCARRGWLRMGIAWLNDVPTAAQLWIVAGGRANIVKVAYDERYKALTSATLVTALLMEHVLDTDLVVEVDYLIGDDPYKSNWMSERRERRGLIAYDPRTLQGLLGLARQAFGAAWRQVRGARPAKADNPDS